MNTALITGASRGLGRALGAAPRPRGRPPGAGRARERTRWKKWRKRSAPGRARTIRSSRLRRTWEKSRPFIRWRPRRPQRSVRSSCWSITRAPWGRRPLGLLMDTDCEDLEAVLRTNLLGPFRLAKALAGPMLLREHGLIVSISSDAAVEAYPRWGELRRIQGGPGSSEPCFRGGAG